MPQLDTQRAAPVEVPVPGQVRFAGRRTWLPRFFFVTGGHKCGTSWLSWMIDAHPEVVCRSAGRFLGMEVSSEHWLKVRAFKEWSAFGTVQDSWMNGVPEAQAETAVRRAMLEAVMMLRTPVGVAAVGDKTPMFYLREVRKLRRLFPEATLIAVIRDGRDAVVSHAFHMLRLNDPQFWGDMAHFEAARAWYIRGEGEPVPLFSRQVMEYAADNWRVSVEGTTQAREVFRREYLELRYEEMVVDPAPSMRRVFEALGVDASDGVIARVIEANRFESRSGGRAPGEADPDSFVRKGVVGDWKNHFTDEDRALFKEIAGAALVEQGYEPDGSW